MYNDVSENNKTRNVVCVIKRLKKKHYQGTSIQIFKNRRHIPMNGNKHSVCDVTNIFYWYNIKYKSNEVLKNRKSIQNVWK